MMLDLFGRGREKCAERDIIRAGLGGFHRQMAAIVAGHADLCFSPNSSTRLARDRHRPAPDERRRLSSRLASADAVVDDEGDVMARADCL